MSTVLLFNELKLSVGHSPSHSPSMCELLMYWYKLFVRHNVGTFSEWINLDFNGCNGYSKHISELVFGSFE